MNNNDDISDLVVQFVDESIELLDEATRLSIGLASDSDDSEAINEIFRTLHSIKGNSAILGFFKIRKITHSLEDLIDSIRAKKILMDEVVLDVFIRGTDILKQIFDSIRDCGLEGEDESACDSFLEEVAGKVK